MWADFFLCLKQYDNISPWTKSIWTHLTCLYHMKSDSPDLSSLEPSAATYYVCVGQNCMVHGVMQSIKNKYKYGHTKQVIRSVLGLLEDWVLATVAWKAVVNMRHFQHNVVTNYIYSRFRTTSANKPTTGTWLKGRLHIGYIFLKFPTYSTNDWTFMCT